MSSWKTAEQLCFFSYLSSNLLFTFFVANTSKKKETCQVGLKKLRVLNYFSTNSVPQKGNLPNLALSFILPSQTLWGMELFLIIFFACALWISKFFPEDNSAFQWKKFFFDERPKMTKNSVLKFQNLQKRFFVNFLFNFNSQ